jgi:uncharacterized protein YndB with AHSA1/START domain
MMQEKRLSIIIELGKQEVVITREFDSSRELVFKGFTDPEAIPLWWGPRYLSTTVEIMEVKQGGRWRFVQYDPQGNTHAFHGVYHEVVKPERITNTFEYEGVPGHVILESYRFEEQNGVTVLTSHAVFQSIEDRDGMAQANMEIGIRESYERLTEYLSTIK